MADDKAKKPEGWNLDPIETAYVLIMLLGFLTIILPMILSYLFSGTITFYGVKISSIIKFFTSNAVWFKILGFVVAGVAAIYAFIFNKKGDEIAAAQRAKVYPSTIFEKKDTEVRPVAAEILASPAEPVVNPLNEKWQNIIRLSESENSSDWRLAVIEADIMLDELLQTLHLPGDTMGEKLKAIEKSDFNTLDAAWEAHKFRNEIAHQGSDFLVNQREIRRILSLYELVFKEFEMI